MATKRKDPKTFFDADCMRERSAAADINCLDLGSEFLTKVEAT
jgi:hypothetical protein